MDSLCGIIQSEFGPDCLDLHRTKCALLVKKVLSPHFQNELIKDLQSAPFSMMVDETTDIATSKLLACSIRYYSATNKTVITTFLDILELSEADAKSLTAAVLGVIEKWGLDKAKFIGLSTDGASTMIGQHNSLQSLLKKEFPSLVHLRCCCHSIDLAAKDAVKKALPSNLEAMVRDSYGWFAHSSARQQAYRQLVELIGTESLADEEEDSCAKPLKLMSLSTTRWLIIADCVERILQQYDALKTHFSIAGEKERCYDAKHLAMMYHNKDNFLYLHFLLPVLKELKCLTKLFQSNTQETLRIYISMRTYFRSLASRILKPAVVKLHTDDSLCDLDLTSGFCLLEDSDVDYGAKFQSMMEKEVSPQERKNIKQRCKNFLVELFVGLQKRFKGSLILMTRVVPLSYPEIVSAKTQSTLFPAPFFPQDLASQGMLEESHRKLKLMSWTSQETSSFWLEVYHYRDALGQQTFANLAGGVLRILCLPISNAEVERVFSQVSLVKDRRRNRMDTDTLEAILYCRFGLTRLRESADTYMPPAGILHYDSSIY